MPDGQIGPATKWLVLANVALGMLFFFDGIFNEAVTAGGLYAGRFTVGDGGYEGFLLPVWLTPFSAAFLHGGFAHLLLNMIMLLLMGKWLEPVYGWRLFLLLYVIGLIVAAATEVFASHRGFYGAGELFVPAIGASGAISALIGAYTLLFPREKPKPIGPIPVFIARPLTLMMGWVAINLMLAFVGGNIGIGIAIWSHIGGFGLGLALAIPLIKWKFRNA